MAEIKNYTLNFVSGRPAALTFASLTSACDEIELRRRCADAAASVEVC
ncbi:hypothetical protein [Parasulfuritortus cantonensis]|nr:hypothetical protein [Parasulfuritortus cantonensis]